MRIAAVLALAGLALSTPACGSGTNKRVITRPDSYEKLIGFPATGNPLDIPALEKEYPELKGIVVTAPEYLEEWDRLRKEMEARGETIVSYRIPPGAQINIEVYNEPDFNRTYYVGPHGYIDMPHIGEIQVVGLTVRELKTSLRDKLLRYLKKPEVLVHILQTPATLSQNASLTGGTGGTSGNGGIMIFGAVSGRALGNIGFTGSETIVSVLGFFGLPATADWRQIRIIRRSNEDPLRKSRVIIVDMWNYFAHADVRQDIPLLPGDVIFVPVKLTLGEQISKDWGMVKSYMSDVLFLDQFREAVRSGGALRD